MKSFGVSTFFFIVVLLTLYKHTDASSDYIMEGDMDYGMRIVGEIPGILLTDCIFRCKKNAQCEIPGLRHNAQGVMTSCLFLAVNGNDTMNGTLVQGNMTKRLFEITDKAKFEKDVHNIKESFNPKRYCQWVLQSSKMCLGAKNNDYGEFIATQGGKFSGIKFEHISGILACTSTHSSRWGCPYDDADNLGLIVTDEKNNAIFPTQYRPDKKLNQWYKIPNMKGNGDYLTLFYPESSMKVDAYAEIRVWFLEDWIKTKTGDNSGKLCVKVFAKYNC